MVYEVKQSDVTPLTNKELKRVRLAGQLARGLRYFLMLVMGLLVLLLMAGLYIYFKGGVR